MLAIVDSVRLAFAGLPGAWHQKPGKTKNKNNIRKKGRKMLGKVKKIFFSGMFGVLYISFIAQLIYVLGYTTVDQGMFAFLALLSVEWLVLTAARYLARRAVAAGAPRNNFGGGRRH